MSAVPAYPAPSRPYLGGKIPACKLLDILGAALDQLLCRISQIVPAGKVDICQLVPIVVGQAQVRTGAASGRPCPSLIPAYLPASGCPRHCCLCGRSVARSGPRGWRIACHLGVASRHQWMPLKLKSSSLVTTDLHLAAQPRQRRCPSLKPVLHAQGHAPSR